MCSASMGAEGSVTLQLREAVQAPVSDSNATINNVTIGYPDPEVLADMLGTFQAAASETTFDIEKKNGNRAQNIANTFFKASGLTTTTINKTETGTWSGFHRRRWRRIENKKERINGGKCHVQIQKFPL